MERWEKLLAVQRMQNYISSHIMGPITLGELARTAGYSPWHAARVFRELTGKAPFDYIRSLRLSRAAERLSKGGGRVVDVAFDFLFGSHEGFTRAFTKQFGTTPKDCAKGANVKLFMPPRVQDYYLTLQKGEVDNMSENINTVFVQVVERPKRKVILKCGVKAAHYFEYCEEVG
jgi:AraC family transcriptional regulator